MQFREARLDNGLSIVAECNGDARSLGLAFAVRAGSRDENDAVAGVSHFLEHMAFKGTPRRSADDVNREFDELGADYNARTGEDLTIYYGAVLPEQQDPMLALLADILRPSLRQADFDTEKQVILEEIGMYEDQPPFNADEKLKAFYFDGHPLGRSVLGTVESITDLSVEAMRAYHAQRYAPENVVLVAAGNVDFERLVEHARACCGDWPARRAPRNYPPLAPRSGFATIVKENATQQYTLQLSPGPDVNDPSRHAAKLLTTVVGDDTGSRLFWELVDTGLAEHANLYHSEYDGAGTLVTTMSCDPATIEDNLRIIADLYRAVQSDGISAAELDQAKNKLRARIVLASERPMARMFSLLSDWLLTGQYRSTDDDLATVDSVQIGDIRTMLDRFPLTHGAMLTIGPVYGLTAPK